MQGTQQEPGEGQLSIGWHNGVAEAAAEPGAAEPGAVEPGDDYHLERAAAYAAILSRTLTAQGYGPRRLDIVLRRGAQGLLEMRVRGDVPGIAEPDFVGLAQVTLHAANLTPHLTGLGEVQLKATLAPPPTGVPPGVGVPPAVGFPPRVVIPPGVGQPPGVGEPPGVGSKPRVVIPELAATTPPLANPAWRRGVLLSRVAAAVVLGVLLGVVGLPRLELPFPAPGAQPRPAAVVVQDVPTPLPVPPTAVPALPTVSALSTTAPVLPTMAVLPTAVPAPPTAAVVSLPTVAGAPTVPVLSTAVAALPTVAVLTMPTVPGAPTVALGPADEVAVPLRSRVVFADEFSRPLANWPNDPRGTAWFADSAYHLFAREATRFVALGVPLPQADFSSAVLSGEFRKIGGPAGGGYGFIVRDQGAVAERDGINQGGRYMVLEVGDRGDVGVWQRDETHWIDVLPWTRSGVVRGDREPNVLVVTVRGNALQFNVNGQVVADLTYAGVPSTGNVGIFVGGDLNEVVLNWLRIEVS